MSRSSRVKDAVGVTPWVSADQPTWGGAKKSQGRRESRSFNHKNQSLSVHFIYYQLMKQNHGQKVKVILNEGSIEEQEI